MLVLQLLGEKHKNNSSSTLYLSQCQEAVFLQRYHLVWLVGFGGVLLFWGIIFSSAKMFVLVEVEGYSCPPEWDKAILQNVRIALKLEIASPTTPVVTCL